MIKAMLVKSNMLLCHCFYCSVYALDTFILAMLQEAHITTTNTSQTNYSDKQMVKLQLASHLCQIPAAFLQVVIPVSSMLSSSV